jgi:hypothetical protein
VSYAVDLRIGGSITLIPAAPVIVARVTTRIGGISITGAGDMAYNMPVQTQVNVQVAYVDKGGNPAAIDGEVTWSSSNDAIVSVSSQGPDIANVMAMSTLGSAQVTASADADLGAGTRTLLTLLDVTVVAGEAVAGTISPIGTPGPIP